MKTYFPNLNTLRFLAATMVVIFHIELYKMFCDVPNLFYLPFFKIVGKLSVVLFFVLSGFLITSLLLNEIEKHQRINFKNFYLRRIFRIWPLYFLILILGFFVIPHFPQWSEVPNPAFKPVSEHFWEKLLLYIFILPNLAVAYFGEITGTSQSWSLGTEEQFYLFWPLIIFFFRKRIIWSMVILLIFYWIVKIGLGKAGSLDACFNILSRFWSLFNINCMAIGGIFAALHFDKHIKLLKVLYHKLVFFAAIIWLIISLSLGINYGFFHYEIYSLLFGTIILNLACNPIYSETLEYKPLNYLGSISYGVYMYHPAILPLAIIAGKYLDSNIVIYGITLGGTFLISALSYEYFEKPFLRLKNKFA